MQRALTIPQNRRKLMRRWAACVLIAAGLTVPASAQNKTETAALRIRVRVVPVVFPPGKRKKDDAPVSYIMDTHPVQIEVSEERHIFQDVRTGRNAVLKTTTVVAK
jgi:hypothetical protein